MKELPYFQFTISEWQNGDVTLQTDSIQGVFINICAYYWSQNCEVTLEMLENKFGKKQKALSKLFQKGIIKQSDSHIYINFLDKQLELLNKDHAFFSEMGKRGQKVKKAKAPLKAPLSEGLSNKIDKRRKEEREKDFLKTLTLFKDSFSKDILNSFYKHWTEPNAEGLMRFELQSFWNLKSRLEKWQKTERKDPVVSTAPNSRTPATVRASDTPPPLPPEEEEQAQNDLKQGFNNILKRST